MPRAVYWVSVDGNDISSTLDPLLTSITINLSAESKSDSLEIELDDSEGQIEIPRSGASIQAGIGWEDGGAFVQFEGKVEKPTSTGGRGQGMMLTISAKSEDRRGKLKDRKQKHKDKGKFKETAEEFAKEAGLSVKVAGDLASIEREYWSMNGETFMAWGHRVARELGATFKIFNDQAVFVPRSSGQSASGKHLTPVSASYPGNIINWSLSPVEGWPEFKKFTVRWYDREEAKWKAESAEGSSGGSGGGAEAERSVRWSAPDKEQAKKRAESNEKDSDRERGGGSVTLDGTPEAQPEATCSVSIGKGQIDGSYRIESVSHSLTRSAGFTTTLELKQPSSGGSGESGGAGGGA